MARSCMLALAMLVMGCARGARATHDAGPTHGDAGVATAHRATALVTGGVVARSPHYMLVGTMTAHGGTSSSPNHTIHTGVVGASQ